MIYKIKIINSIRVESIHSWKGNKLGDMSSAASEKKYILLFIKDYRFLQCQQRYHGQNHSVASLSELLVDAFTAESFEND